ncbi:hypothetical protein GQ600_11027 [Phytophthora cactorum]|nr:hypothetical protein GQ600_11027 [Phytophthora cactorum]
MAVHEVHLSHGVLRQRLQWVFDCKRVHFRPKLLPDTVKSHITEKFHARQIFDGLALRSKLPLPAFVRHVSGQTDADGSPNKALFEIPVPFNFHRQSMFHRWNDIV